MSEHMRGRLRWICDSRMNVRVLRACDVANGDYDNPLADVYGATTDEVESYATLFAAAPELLEACLESDNHLTAIIEADDCYDDSTHPLCQSRQWLRAAIAKATGASHDTR